MRPARKLLVLTATIMVAICTAGYLKYSSDLTASGRVQDSLTRLSSGIEFEPLITLCSKIADTDTAIKIFESGFHLFPRKYNHSLESAKRGVRYIAIAIDDAKTINGWDDMREYMDVTPLIVRVCEGDHLAFPREAIKGGFASLGYYLVKGAAGELSFTDEIQFRPQAKRLDLVKENASCNQQFAEAQLAAAQAAAERAKVAAERVKAMKYHIDVVNTRACMISADADGKTVLTYSVVQRFHLDANSDASLTEVYCTTDLGNPTFPGDKIAVKINGLEYQLDWVKKTGGSYAVILAPTND